MALGSADFGDRCSSLVAMVVDSWLGRRLVDRDVCWNESVCRIAVSGCGETQEELLPGVEQDIHDFDGSGMTR